MTKTAGASSPAVFLFRWRVRRYDTPGKQAFRQLLFDLATQTGVRTYGTFWGTGIDSRLFAPHFDVVACEIRESKQPLMEADSLVNGYRVFLGSAGRLAERCDMFFADFDGTASPGNFKELRKIASQTDKWLAVTLANSHKLAPELQDEAACYTIPAWLTGAAANFTLEYVSGYASEGRQRMWVAILQRREGRGVAHTVQPIQIARSLQERSYWASRPMYAMGLMRHRQEARTPITRLGDARRYQLKKATRPRVRRICRHCDVLFVVPLGRGRRPGYCSKRCQKSARSDYRRRWYRERVAAVSGTAAKPSILEEAA